MLHKSTLRKWVIVAVAFFAMPLATPALSDNTVTGLNQTTDVLVGHNNAGPYTLAWTNIDSSSVVVVINGRILRRDVDYNIDVAAGVIGFNAVVLEDAIVRVTYSTTPKSQHTSTAVSVPVTLNLLQGDQGSLQLTGQYSQNDPNNPSSGKTVLGVGGTEKWNKTSFSSMLLVSQNSDPNSKSSQSGMAGKFGGSTSVGAFTLTGNYIYAGNDFAGANQYNIGTGKQSTDVAAQFAPGKAFQAGIRLQQSEDTAGGSAGTHSDVLQGNWIWKPTSGTNISFNHSNTTTSAADTQQSVDSNQLLVHQDFMKTKTAAVASVDAGFTTLTNDTVGSQTGTDVKITANPISQIGVQATLSQTDSSKLGQTLNSNIAIQASPVKSIQIQAHLVESKDSVNDQRQTDISVSSNPLKCAKISAIFSQKDATTESDVTEGATLELTPVANTRFSAGYKYVQTGGTILTIKDYVATSKLFNFVNMTGSYRDRQQNLGDVSDSAGVQLAVSPVKYFTFTGNYQENPEDSTGVVQSCNNTTAGLVTHIGSVGLTTNYTQSDQYKIGTLTDERKIGLEVPVTHNAKLTTGYACSRSITGSDLMSNTYSLGFQHHLGSDFSFSLNGYLTQWIQDSMLQKDKNEISARADLGIKF